MTDTYHGVRVVDNYRWLENYSNPAVRAWSAAQNRYARKYLDALPLRPAIVEELNRLYKKRSPQYYALAARPGALFALKSDPTLEQPLLVVLKSPDDLASERAVVDPNSMDPSGGAEIDFFVPSIDGKRVAVSISKGGSESGDLHFYDVASGKEIGEPVPRVNGGTAGGSAAWNADGSGVYYTHYPRPGERPRADLSFYQQIYFHRIDVPASRDAYSLGKDFPRIAEIQLQSSDDGRYVLARMANGDGGEFAHYLLGPDGEWRQLSSLADDIVSGAFGTDGYLYLISRHNAPMGAVLKLPLDRPQLDQAETVVPEGKTVIQAVVPIGDRLFVQDMMGGPASIRIVGGGRGPGGVATAPICSIDQMLRAGNDLLFQQDTYLEPPRWYRFSPSSRSTSLTALHDNAPVNFNDAEVIRDFATSQDGTKVPINIILRKGTKLDGKNPAILTGYGGFDISMTPAFSVRLRPLLDRGIVYAIASLRGGGEYGEAWHRAGAGNNKQNVFDDFAACARYLIDHHYSSPDHLAIEGASNGGLLMGAALTQHPELFRAVVSQVGIYDMLRIELFANGVFNTTEYGTIKEADEFRALLAYSPYQHVVDGTQYPAVLFMTGENDPRVDPANSRKMTARLQAAGTKLPVLLRTSGNSGHGIGTALSEAISEDADAIAFLCGQLGIH